MVEDLSGEPWSPPGARTLPVDGDADAKLVEASQAIARLVRS